MATIDGSIYIDRLPEVVFDVVADERNEPRYNPRMTAVSLLSDPPIGQGSRFTATMKSRARTFSMIVEFTDFERPTRLGSVSTVGSMRTVGALHIRAASVRNAHAVVLGHSTARRLETRGASRVLDRPTPGARIWTGLKTMLEAATWNSNE